ncbi:MAG TPA: hypothetical protein VGF45_09145, partial [Polyangia bacterium]
MNGVDGVSATVMTWLALTVARVTLWLVAVFVAAWLFRRSAAGVRRWLYGLGLAGALLLAFAPALPAIEWEVLPAEKLSAREAFEKAVDERMRPSPRDEGRLTHQPLVEIPASVPARGSAAPPAAALAPQLQAPETTPWTSLRNLLVALYLGGLLFVFARLLLAHRRVVNLARGAKAASEVWSAPPGIVVRESAAVELPITVGALKPVI